MSGPDTLRPVQLRPGRLKTFAVLPPADVNVFATKATLVVGKYVHPAIQYLLLSTAMQLHSGVGMFNRAGRFPAGQGIELPLSSEAVHFYKSGQPFLQHNLPFWIASLVGRMLVLLIPARRSPVPVNSISACFVWLVYAPEDRAPVRRAADSWRTRLHAAADRPTPFS